MATQTRLVLVDDLDGGPASTTVEFGLDRNRYAIDLSAENAARLREVLSEYIEAARVRHAAPAAALRRSSRPRTTVAAAPARPATRAPAGSPAAGPAGPAGPEPSSYAEFVEIIAELTTDVRRAVLEVLLEVLEVLHHRLAAARRSAPP